MIISKIKRIYRVRFQLHDRRYYFVWDQACWAAPFLWHPKKYRAKYKVKIKKERILREKAVVQGAFFFIGAGFLRFTCSIFPFHYRLKFEAQMPKKAEFWIRMPRILGSVFLVFTPSRFNPSTTSFLWKFFAETV